MLCSEVTEHNRRFNDRENLPQCSTKYIVCSFGATTPPRTPENVPDCLDAPLALNSEHPKHATKGGQRLKMRIVRRLQHGPRCALQIRLQG